MERRRSREATSEAGVGWSARYIMMPSLYVTLSGAHRAGVSPDQDQTSVHAGGSFENSLQLIIGDRLWRPCMDSGLHPLHLIKHRTVGLTDEGLGLGLPV